MKPYTPPSDLTRFARRILHGVDVGLWTIVQVAEIEGGGRVACGIVCHASTGELRPFAVTEGDGG